MKVKIASTLLLSFVLFGCAKIYYSADAKELASQHKKLAILPPKVSIAAQKRVDAEAIKEQQITESLNFQQEMYTWMLRRKTQANLSMDIQDVSNTNAILKRINYTSGIYTSKQLCDSLGVDALLESNYGLTKPISDGGAIALAVLVGVSTATNQVTVTLNLKDCSGEKLIWSYNHKYSAGVGSTPTSVVDAIMRKASRKRPYFMP
jgi:hypothetical protein